jgi:16S rRNA (guanine966-N2)-methyltransferase
MRVIAGKCRSLPLKTIQGTDTRPTTDRIKETLFNMLQPRLPGCRFLDLFAGSGAIGIEALSRGASFCCFVEQSRKAAACIRENLRFTGLEKDSQLLVTDARRAAEQLRGAEPFDLIFMDPPYRKNLEREVLELLRDSPIVAEHALFVTEAALDTDFSWLEAAGYVCIREKKYKTNAHLFLERAGRKA